MCFCIAGYFLKTAVNQRQAQKHALKTLVFLMSQTTLQPIRSTCDRQPVSEGRRGSFAYS